jgi:hypothetical protein
MPISININILLGQYATGQMTELALIGELEKIGFSDAIIEVLLNMAYDQKRRNDERTQANTERV